VLAITEESLRCVNNLLERFHQSFFFYLLPTPTRYISIGMYFPPLLLIGLNLMWKGMLVWYLTSDWKVEDDLAATGADWSPGPKPTISDDDGDDPIDRLPREPAYSVRPRYLFEPTVVIGFCFMCGVGVFMAPAYGYTKWVPAVFGGGIVAGWLVFQVLAGLAVRRRRRPATKLDQPAPASYILYCFTLILTCILFISVAILNFSLSFGLLVMTVPVYLQLLPLTSDYGYARAAWRTFIVLPAVLLLSPYGVALWSSYMGRYGFDEWMHAVADLPTTLTALDIDQWLSTVRSVNAWELATAAHQHLPDLTGAINTLNDDYLLMGRWLWPFVALVWTPISMLAAVLCLV
jgi:GPI-anchor transamidase subunit GAA1